jgi:hypothetical protein
MVTQTPAMTTKELNELLYAHFIREEDRIDQRGAGAVYLNEVTAPNSNRRADAVYMGLWQSRGAGRIDVCELKVSKADFRRELDKPEKAEAWWPYCNAFWIVAPSTSVAPPEELPDGWGLMVPGRRGRRFETVVKAKEHEATLTLGLLITLIKCTETYRSNTLRQQGDKLRNEFLEREQRIRRERGAFGGEDRRRLEHLDQLEEALGMRLSDYPWGAQITPEAAAGGLKTFMQGQRAIEAAKQDAESAIRGLEMASKQAAEQARRLKEAMGIK